MAAQSGRRPRVAVLGVGAVGGCVAAVLEHAGHCDVTLVARGATLAALVENGLTVHMFDEDAPPFTCHPRCVSVDDTASAGEQDFVLLCTKAHQLPPLVDKLLPLFGEHTVLVPVMNGIPFWHSFGLRGVTDAPVLAVDPGGRLHAELGAARAIGCVVRVGGSVLAPGIIKMAGNQPALEFGEPDGRLDSPRLCDLMGLFADEAPDKPIDFLVSEKPVIRNGVWDKLVFNVVGNSLQTLTQATAGDLVGDPALLQVCRGMVAEMFTIGAAIGIEFTVTIKQMVEGFNKFSSAKASTLQDLEAGRPFEKDAIMTAVQQIAAEAGVSIPLIDMAAALLAGLERNAVLSKL